MYKKSYLDSNEINCLYIFDSVSYRYSSNTCTKMDSKTLMHSEFEDCFLFLSNYIDSFVYSSSDSLYNINDSQFGVYTQYSYPNKIIVKQNFTMGKRYLSSKEFYYNDVFTIPKHYSKIIYSNVVYHKNIPEEFENKINHELKKVNKLNSEIEKNKSDRKKSNFITYLTNPSKISFTPILRDEKLYSLDSLISSREYTMVYFWFEGCIPCKKIKPVVDSIFLQYSRLGLEIIGLNNMDKADIISKYDNYFYNYYDYTKNYNLLKCGYPTIVIINRNSEIIARLNGADYSDIEKMKRFLDSILSN